MSKALILGATGQDGAYLARFLLARGYEVVGAARQVTGDALWRLSALGVADALRLHAVDVCDPGQTRELLRRERPSEIYNFSGLSSVWASWQDMPASALVNGLAAVWLYEAVADVLPGARLYQASSSEMFGEGVPYPAGENTPFRPANPYGSAKLVAHLHAGLYRQTRGLHVCCGITFNHESPLRTPDFLFRKLSAAVAAIRRGEQKTVSLGTLHARRDWGFAGDYVEAMWLMLQQETADDYVLATGRSVTVETVCDLAFRAAGLDYRDHVRTDSGQARPREVAAVAGNPARALDVLGWRARMPLEDLVCHMVEADMKRPGAGR